MVSDTLQRTSGVSSKYRPYKGGRDGTPMSKSKVGVVIPVVLNDDQDYYENLLDKRAVPSVNNQTFKPHLFVSLGTTLRMARNNGAKYLNNVHNVEWIIFLDADDELDPHYVESMVKAEGDII